MFITDLNQFIFVLLEGRWALKRQISGAGRMAGCGEFSRVADNKLAYAESGVFTTRQGVSLRVNKRYDIVLGQQGIGVYCADGLRQGQLFHTFDQLVPASAERCFPIKCQGEYLSVLHHCKAEYRFCDPDQFALTYHVSGPKKHYISQTVFERNDGKYREISGSLSKKRLCTKHEL